MFHSTGKTPRFYSAFITTTGVTLGKERLGLRGQHERMGPQSPSGCWDGESVVRKLGPSAFCLRQEHGFPVVFPSPGELRNPYFSV